MEICAFNLTFRTVAEIEPFNGTFRRVVKTCFKQHLTKEINSGIEFRRIDTNGGGQVLFDEDDVAGRVPKAIAAVEKLSRINSEITLEPIVADIDHTNILRFFEGIDLVVDGGWTGKGM